jgi:hypothetical protein
MKTRIDFEVEGKQYYVLRPTQKQTVDAELIYKTKYSEALRYGALTTAEALRIIEERGIYSKQDAKYVASLLKEVQEIGTKLQTEESIHKGIDLIGEIEEKRYEILKTNQKRNTVLDNTSESYADEKRLQFYIVSCTFQEDGKPVYETVDDLVDASDTKLAAEATKFTIYVIANQGEDFRRDWPDYKWRVKQGLVDENLNALDELPKSIVEKLDKESKTIKKKTPRKKKATKKTAKK